MREQQPLLETDWDVLIILDACRWDVFHEVTGLGEPVMVPNVNTPGWLHVNGRIIKREDLIYYTANPVVNRENERRKLRLPVVSVWEYLWGCHADDVPSVHPRAVNGAVLQDCFAHDRLLGKSVVIHYLQPHAPYIGQEPLALGRWGRGWGRDVLTMQMRRCMKPMRAIKSGHVTWEQLRAAYRANLELVWQAARDLIRVLPGQVIVTADHGEMLGENGRFGHEGNWQNEEILHTVPWLEVTADVRESLYDDVENAHESMQAKLEALGYA